MKHRKGGKMKPERIFRKCTIQIDGAVSTFDGGIITSENDESAGKYCPYCGKTELETVRVPEFTKITLNPHKEGNHQWSFDICTCKTCWNDWFLYVNETGRRELIYETNPSDDIDEMEVDMDELKDDIDVTKFIG
jgi:hypothetical protein